MKGYLVADNDERFWFVGFDGKVVWQQAAGNEVADTRTENWL